MIGIEGKNKICVFKQKQFSYATDASEFKLHRLGTPRQRVHASFAGPNNSTLPSVQQLLSYGLSRRNSARPVLCSLNPTEILLSVCAFCSFLF